MKMSNPTLRIAPLMLAVALAAGHAHADKAPADFDRYDANKDGVVSLDEFKAKGGKPEAFAAGDENKDGKLTRQEFIKAAANQDRADARQYLDDGWITTRVKASLVKEQGLAGLEIRVTTTRGAVVLEGEVATLEQARLAESIAANVDGVKAVDNALRVKSEG